MALKIIEECISCGACEPECPNGAISEAEDIYVIDPGHCTECYGFYTTQQCADVCPVEACVKDDKYPETAVELKEKFLSLYPDGHLENTDKWKPPTL
ncbi:YfhL family 4Fe-4S dicluster ferredoxin [Sulfobacillus thermosulfidooxidans]|uniref:YfhL family 4Fe-4S dicluster ferredoxin n=1 Tax=Sulfobacillus thermosulfidooxidans TaxID=28034 RepID=UPI0006B538EB|nr:YfhL family 4Fe-4S dicluster ferredoxin [Sulfobacillus thermosulfidooxidans]